MKEVLELTMTLDSLKESLAKELDIEADLKKLLELTERAVTVQEVGN